jgi:hypothetical protein
MHAEIGTVKNLTYAFKFEQRAAFDQAPVPLETYIESQML